MKIIRISSAIFAILLVGGGLWWYLANHTQTTSQTSKNLFGLSNTNSQTFSTPVTTNNTGVVSSSGNQLSTSKIFKIASGPVSGATFVQTFNPTTTVARYVMQDSGHVYDQAIDVPGALLRSVSNTTVPGIANSQWFVGGGGILLQYIEGSLVKTVSVGFATSTASTTAPRIHFLPDNIIGMAVSPNGSETVYLLKTPTGVAGYVANADGTNSKKLFSLPLTEVLISWPSANVILLQTKEAAGVPGIAFSVSAKTGAVTPLLYTSGLSAIANLAFSKIVYATDAANTHTVYAHDVQTGGNVRLSFNPYPEKCVWSSAATTTLFCAAPLDTVPGNYLDLWHEGLASAPDDLLAYSFTSGTASVIAIPGNSQQGGVPSDIASLAVSPDGKYLLFITKGDRSLWGVRLTQ